MRFQFSLAGLWTDLSLTGVVWYQALPWAELGRLADGPFEADVVAALVAVGTVAVVCAADGKPPAESARAAVPHRRTPARVHHGSRAVRLFFAAEEPAGRRLTEIHTAAAVLPKVDSSDSQRESDEPQTHVCHCTRAASVGP